MADSGTILPLTGPCVQPGDVAGVPAVWSVGLKDDIPDAAVLVELADLDRAELGLKGAVHVLYRDPEEHGL